MTPLCTDTWDRGQPVESNHPLSFHLGKHRGMVTAMLLLCVMHMHDVCSMYLSLFAFLTLLMRSPIDMPYRKCNPSRDSHTAVEHDIKVAVSYNKKEPKVSSKYLAGILMDFFLGKYKLKPLSFPNPMMDSIILNSVQGILLDWILWLEAENCLAKSSWIHYKKYFWSGPGSIWGSLAC